MASTASPTSSCEFVFEKDLQEATQQIRDEISAIRNDLPPEMEEPILTRFDPADLPIVSLTLSSPKVSGAELTPLADPGITRQLRALRGVAQVNVVGGIEREMTVDLNPPALQAAGIGISQVVQALQAQNLAAPVGRITGDLEERTIRLRGRLDDSGRLRAARRRRAGRPDHPSRRRRTSPCGHRGAAVGGAVQR